MWGPCWILSWYVYFWYLLWVTLSQNCISVPLYNCACFSWAHLPARWSQKAGDWGSCGWGLVVTSGGRGKVPAPSIADMSFVQVAVVTVSSCWLRSLANLVWVQLVCQAGAEAETEMLASLVCNITALNKLLILNKDLWLMQRRRSGVGHSTAIGKCDFSDHEIPYLCWYFSSSCHSTLENSSFQAVVLNLNLSQTRERIKVLGVILDSTWS